MKRCLLVISALIPLSAFGQGFGPLRYDYVAGSLVIPKLDRIGLEFEGSTAVTKDLVVFGSYRDYKPSDRLDRQTAAIGVGYRWNVRPNMDLMASLSYADNEFERRGVDSSDEGLVLAGQIRGWVTGKLELNGTLMLDDSAGSGTDTVLVLGGQYFHRANSSFGGRIRVDEDDTTVFLGLRFYFGASRR